MVSIRMTLLALLVAVPATAETFTVTTTDFEGPGSLRQTLRDVNASLGPHRIEFAIPGEGPHVLYIAPGTFSLYQEVVIDGYTQPGSRPNTSTTGFDADLRIVIDGHYVFPGGSHTISAWGEKLEVRGIAFAYNTGITVHPGSAVVVTGCSFERSYLEASGSGSRIGGASPAERNLVQNSFGYAGITIFGAVSPIIENNLIGTDATGFESRANCRGIWAGVSHSVTVRGNVISGNQCGPYEEREGVFLDRLGVASPSGAPNLIVGNRIGVAGDGMTPLPNDAGIRVSNGESVELRDNVIRYNEGSGVLIEGALPAGAHGTTLFGNSIADNGESGIDLLGTPGVTPNDPGDGDEGPNDLVNFPVLLGRSLGPTGGVIRGALEAAPETTYSVEVFASALCDDTGHGEGEVSLGTFPVTTGAGGTAELALNVTGDHRGRFLTATASTARGTSEFSACLGPTGPVEVPTASGWGLLAVGLVLASAAVRQLGRR